jgi:hypothetical protein
MIGHDDAVPSRGSLLPRVYEIALLPAIDAKRNARNRAGFGEGDRTDEDVRRELARWYASRFDATLDDPDREAHQMASAR